MNSLTAILPGSMAVMNGSGKGNTRDRAQIGPEREAGAHKRDWGSRWSYMCDSVTLDLLADEPLDSYVEVLGRDLSNKIERGVPEPAPQGFQTRPRISPLPITPPP